MIGSMVHTRMHLPNTIEISPSLLIIEVGSEDLHRPSTQEILEGGHLLLIDLSIRTRGEVLGIDKFGIAAEEDGFSVGEVEEVLVNGIDDGRYERADNRRDTVEGGGISYEWSWFSAKYGGGGGWKVLTRAKLDEICEELDAVHAVGDETRRIDDLE